MRGLWIGAAVALVAVLALRLLNSMGEGEPLPVLGTVPEFELIDQNGAAYSSEELEKRVWMASFIYTTCPGPCPVVVERQRAVYARLSNDPRITLVSFSVDPEADTPEVLAVYGRNHSIDASHWKLLTGDTDQVYRLIRDAFHLGVERVEYNGAAEVPPDGPIVHSTRLVLVDGRFRVRGYYDTDDAQALRALAVDAARLVREAGS